MKLSFLLLPALLALSSASVLDIMKQSSQHRNDPLKLKWQTWRCYLPSNSVSVYSYSLDRVDYVCKYGCHSGFYNPNKGPYCHYPYGNKEYRVSQFEILVNEDNFEILEWREGSYGSVPPNSIRTCYGDELYVGRNRYGLGKVHPAHEAFFLPREGRESWYKHYEVLTIRKDVVSEQISNVKYNINEAEIFQYPPETMRISSITNYENNSVLQKATLSKTNRVERRWDSSSSRMFGIKTTFTAGIPNVISGSIEISNQMSFQFSEGHTFSEETTHSVSVELSVPPNHYCRALMVGHKYKVNIPYTAQLSRTYRNGEFRRTLIYGTYEGVEIGEVKSVIERCKPVTKSEL